MSFLTVTSFAGPSSIISIERFCYSPNTPHSRHNAQAGGNPAPRRGHPHQHPHCGVPIYGTGDTESPLRAACQRRNRDLDPQLVWRGKDEQDLADLVVYVPPLYIQEKVHPKALIADLLRQSRHNREA